MPALLQQRQLCQRWPQPQPQPPPQRRRRVASVVVRACLSRRTALAAATGLGGCGCARCGCYDAFFAANMAHGMADYEAAVHPVKAQLFQQLLAPLSGSASVLEVGLGTGPNLPFYSNAATSSGLSLRLTGLEPNTAMWRYAREAAAAAGQPTVSLELVDGDAQAMPFPADSFDAAAITLVLCSVQQPQRVLDEVARVLKPGGHLLVMEHVIAPHLGLLQLQQRLLDPLQQLLADRCHLTRDTAAVLLASSLEPQPLPPLPPRVQDLTAARRSSNGVDSSGDLWRFEVEGMGLISPHVAAVMRKPM